MFLGDGAIPFDNNGTENEFRSLTIGRQNWLFVGSSRGGEVAAAMYSVVSSAPRHDAGQASRRLTTQQRRLRRREARVA